MTGKKGQRSTKTTGMPNRYTETMTKELDGRYRVAKELKARLETLLADLGGEGALSTQQKMLAERATFIQVLLESKERDLVKGNKFDVGTYLQAVNTLLGVLRSLGLKRSEKIIPHLQEYITQREENDND